MNDITPFKIVLVEDNPADVTLVREALDRHEVNCALHVLCDGEKALDLLNRIDNESGPSQLDLLILDMHLPGHDGNEILGKLHSTKRYARTPVVLMTLQPSHRIDKYAAESAPLVYFGKPCTLTEFMNLGLIVRDLLSHQNGYLLASVAHS